MPKPSRSPRVGPVLYPRLRSPHRHLHRTQWFEHGGAGNRLPATKRAVGWYSKMNEEGVKHSKPASGPPRYQWLLCGIDSPCMVGVGGA